MPPHQVKSIVDPALSFRIRLPRSVGLRGSYRQEIGYPTKTVQRAIKKLEKLKFLSVKRFPGTGEVNRYSLNHDAIRKAIEKVVYGFDSGLSQLLEQVQSGTGNKKFRDFLDRRKLIDSAGTIDLSGLSAIGTTLAEISQAMNADSTQKEPEPEKTLTFQTLLTSRQMSTLEILTGKTFAQRSRNCF